MALVEIKNVTYGYPGTESPSLRDVDLKVEKGEFVLVTGPTGCGKTSLMRLLNGLIPHFHGGRMSGKVRVAGRDTLQSEPAELALQVGMVFQDAEDQLVSTTVEKEIAFGLENAGLPAPVIRKRVEEMLAGLGLSRLRRSFIPELSGGETQKTVLASVMALHPQILVLDEPTSQLDPLSAEDLLTMVRRLHEETGTTVIMSEHRLERCYHFATRVLYMEEGRILFDGPPQAAARWCAGHDDAFLPPISRIFARAGWDEIPLTVNRARQMLEEVSPRKEGSREAGPAGPVGGSVGGKSARKGKAWHSSMDGEIFRARDMWFVYPHGPEALRDVDLNLRGGTSLALLGENGAGKSTLLRCLLGLLRPSRGKAFLFGEEPAPERLPKLAARLGYCPQNPSTYFVRSTVREELLRTMQLRGSEGAEARRKVDEHLESLGLSGLADRNPRDLSTGEREKVVVASTLLSPLPELVVMDEPTRGLDYRNKRAVIGLLRDFRSSGGTVFVVTHDVEFAAAVADRAAIIGDGSIVTEGEASEVLGDSLFFSPQTNRLLGDRCGGVIREEDAVYILERMRHEGPA